MEDGSGPESAEALKASEELWGELLRDADNLLKKAEVAYSLSRELQAFSSQAADAQAWLDGLRAKLDGIGTDSRGGRARTEDGLNAAHVSGPLDSSIAPLGATSPQLENVPHSDKCCCVCR